jgi:hypothetical protein
VKELVFFLEEESATVLMAGIVHRLLPEGSRIGTRYVVFEGKSDLQKQLERKLRGYANPRARFIVVRDQDQAGCRAIKRSLVKTCKAAARPDAVVRIACRELEAFYLGDLRAVEAGLGMTGLARRQEKARFRDPDQIDYPSRESAKLTDRRYQKVSGSRAIAPHLDLTAPRSKSFRHLIEALRKAGRTLAKPE